MWNFLAILWEVEVWGGPPQTNNLTPRFALHIVLLHFSWKSGMHEAVARFLHSTFWYLSQGWHDLKFKLSERRQRTSSRLQFTLEDICIGLSLLSTVYIRNLLLLLGACTPLPCMYTKLYEYLYVLGIIVCTQISHSGEVVALTCWSVRYSWK